MVFFLPLEWINDATTICIKKEKNSFFEPYWEIKELENFFKIKEWNGVAWSLLIINLRERERERETFDIIFIRLECKLGVFKARKGESYFIL